MTVLEIKNAVMFQTNNDADDLGDFVPFLLDYINEGYDALVHAYSGEHLEESDMLTADTDELSLLPAWAARAVSDYASWMVYRNGNAVKQNRGMAFLQSFNAIKARVLAANSTGTFTNIPW